MSAVVRPVELADYTGVVACLERNGMPTWSRDRWLQIWDDHPYRHDFAGIPRGFVLEDGGQIVGTVSNIWTKYALGQRDLRAALAGNAAVDPSHRAASIQLLGAQLLQPGVDLYLNGSASEAVSKVMDTLKVPRVPQPDNDVVLLWAANGYRVALAGLKRRGVPLGSALAWPVGAGLSFGSRFALRKAGRPQYPVTAVDSFSEEFDDLWRTIRSRATRLTGFRDSAILRWRYMAPIASGNARVLVVRRDTQLVGYAVLMRTPRPGLNLTAYAIHDLQCADEDPAVVGSLLRGAWRETRRASLDLLELAGFAGAKRKLAEGASTLRYRLDVWQAFYRAREPALKLELASPERWEFSPFDSD